ncbi:uncharacterized protein LOC130656452 [Hydractinia symbiolongicarpus]|uniref:uncharacterized protein LOC130656452 n=1 Tax=Hydractinia symbiolongicarpus TaxID=13093 RepID=UPI002551138B|nr:uncharacterized protein LOC130656452 [Hydractinia symbiolongicarpus]
MEGKYLNLDTGSQSKATSRRSTGGKRMEMMVEKQIEELMGSLDLTPLQVEEVQTCFDLFDLHGSGAITGIELQKVAQSVGRELTEEDVTEIIAEVDESGKGEIDFIDFLTVMGKTMKEPLQEADIEYVFNTFDQNNDTFISPEDMHLTFLTMGVDLTRGEVNAMFEEHDKDRDGLIDFNEFQDIVKAVHAGLSSCPPESTSSANLKS